MKYFSTTFIILVLLISISNIHAGQVYTWTDEKGNLHITDSPPPADANIQEVVTVRKQTAAEVEKEQLHEERKKAEDTNEKKQKEIEKAKRLKIQTKKNKRKSRKQNSKPGRPISVRKKRLPRHRKLPAMLKHMSGD
jgi:hypothetical protein